MTEPSPADPAVIAADLLDTVVEQFAAASVALPDKRVLVAGSLPAWDGEQVTVNLQRIYVGMPAQERSTSVAWQQDVMSMQLLVQIVRKATATLANAPRGRMPSRQQISADAADYFRDARLLAGALHTWKKERGRGRTAGGVVVPPEQQGEYVGLSGFVDTIIG